MIKFTKIKPNSRKQNAFIFFGGLHFLVWLIMCFGFGWRGLLCGFLANCIIDTGVLLSWIWQEKHSRKAFASLILRKLRNAKGLRSPQQQENLFVRNHGAQW